MAIVTLTDRPKSVRNRCVIEVFGGVFVLSRCLLDFSVGVRAFVIELSKISSCITFITFILVFNGCLLYCYDLSVYIGVWSLASIKRYIYKFQCVSF